MTGGGGGRGGGGGGGGGGDGQAPRSLARKDVRRSMKQKQEHLEQPTSRAISSQQPRPTASHSSGSHAPASSKQQGPILILDADACWRVAAGGAQITGVK
jgi:hypothetical protein